MEKNTTSTQTRETLLKDVDKLKKDAVQVAQDVRTHANKRVDETKKQVSDTIQTFQDNLTNRPFTLLGIGFAVGFLVALRFTR